MRAVSLGIACALSMTATCLAQDVVGTTIVGGRTVEVMSNYTWRYKGVEIPGCRAIKFSISFCGETLGWQYSPGSNTDATAVFRHDDSNYGEFILEGIGQRRGINLDTLRSAVISNIASFMNTKPEDVVVLSDDAVVLEGQPGETIIYKASSGNVQFVFYNTIFALPDEDVQIATYTVGGDITEEGKRLHREFLEQTHLSPPPMNIAPVEHPALPPARR
jgi:hypothetical protein